MRVEAMLLILATAAAAPANAGAPEDDALPPGLLEFIGGMVESGGELVDPLVLDTDTARPAEEGRQGGDDAAPVAAAQTEESP